MGETKIEEGFKNLLVTLIKKVEDLESRNNDDIVEKINKQTVDIALIKETLVSLKKEDEDTNKKIQNHVNSGAGWRKAIIVNVLSVLILVGSFIYNWGINNANMVTMKELIVDMKTSTSSEIDEMKDEITELKIVNASFKKNELKNKVGE